MTETKTDTRIPTRQLRLYWPVAAWPRLEDATRDAVVRLLARLLTSAVDARFADPEGHDEAR